MKLAAIAVSLICMTGIAYAHSFYSKYHDPIFKNNCCGGSDCNLLTITPANVSAEADGYRVVLTLAETQRINPHSIKPINALVTWDRVIPSEDGNWHICLMPTSRDSAQMGVYCFFAPPNG